MQGWGESIDGTKAPVQTAEDESSRHFGSFLLSTPQPKGKKPTPQTNQPPNHPNQCNQTALPNNLRKSSFILWKTRRDELADVLLLCCCGRLQSDTTSTQYDRQTTLGARADNTSPGIKFRGCCFVARLIDHFLDSPNPVLNGGIH